MKTVLITGVSKGIGRALTEKFLHEGFAVIGTMRDVEKGRGSDLNLELDKDGKNLKVLQLELTNSDSIEKCAEEIKSSGVKIDILINNAGALFDDEETRVVVEKLRQTLEVNLIGTIDFTEQMIPWINKNGHIINISSEAGSLNSSESPSNSHYPNHYPAYKISKAALNMYTVTLANRLKKEDIDITVSSVHPGWIKTDMGGDEAPTLPEEVANDIYDLAISKPKTGQFWYKGDKFPW